MRHILERDVHTWNLRPLARPRQRWENNIKMDDTKIIHEGVDWIDLAQDRTSWQGVVNAAICQVPLNVGNFLKR
jgi:hypothetical protein